MGPSLDSVGYLRKSSPRAGRHRRQGEKLKGSNCKGALGDALSMSSVLEARQWYQSHITGTELGKRGNKALEREMAGGGQTRWPVGCHKHPEESW